MLGFTSAARATRAAATRRFFAYCIGTAKSGTHSVAAMFARDYAAQHEAEHGMMIRTIIARARGEVQEAAVRKMLQERDRRLNLEMDSSQLNSNFVDLLVQEFPAARFILTIRDCLAFVRSITDHSLSRFASDSWQQLREFRFGGFTPTRFDAPLCEGGLYPLDAYLTYWTRHNERALEFCPPERLLIVRTDQINQSIPGVAEFLGIAADTIDGSRAHSYPAVKRHEILDKMDRTYVQERAESICGPLMRRFFPEKTLSAAPDVADSPPPQ